MNSQKVLIIGSGIDVTNFAKTALINIGYSDIEIIEDKEIKERGITINNLPQPFVIKQHEILNDIGIVNNPRKKKKHYTPQPWRNNRKK